MMRIKNKLALLILLLTTATGYAQTDLTLYNMNWTPQSMYQNPALTPETRINIGLPIISSIYAQFSNTGFTWRDAIAVNDQDSLVITPDNLFDALGTRNYNMVNLAVDYLSFGIRVDKNYFSLNLTERVTGRLTYSRDLLGLALYGNGDSRYLGAGNEVDWSGTGLDGQAYRELGLSWTRDMNEEGTFKVGGRLKYLNGTFASRTANSDITLTTDETYYTLSANSDFTHHLSGFNNQMFAQDTANPRAGDYFLGRNHGVGLDLGFQMEVIDSVLRVSASVVDLGFIRYRNDVVNLRSNDATFEFRGLDLNDAPDSLDRVDGDYLDSLLQALGDSISTILLPDSTYDAFNAPTIPRFYIGGNYLINEKMNAGLLFSGELYKGRFLPSLTASYNMQVGKVLQLSASWSYTQRSLLNAGLGFSVNAGPVQFYAVTDNVLAPIVPTRVKHAHVHTGINLTFGREPEDRDQDGVLDKEDECPDTPGLAELNGCPDLDGDKIPDYKDSCVTVPGIAEFNGCPDTDGDGVQDSEDDCVNTPGLMEFNGCPDRDGDGIIDKKDACPDEPGPESTRGCPDRDGDGIIDMEDLCPDKPGDAEHGGCPDTDGDGVYDNNDRCVEEFGPKDNFGCPYGDLDKDGVFDKEDRCPDTPGPVENQGCPYGDLDGDGVTDNVDECPNTPGLAENNGCPVLNEEEEEVLKTAFDNLEFESGKAVIRTRSYESLDSLASLLVKKGDWKLRIAGHTDDVGAASNNLKLSKNRANAVKEYLNSRGVAEERFIVEWYGETEPIAPNTTAAGRQKNRRVEMEVVFE